MNKLTTLVAGAFALSAIALSPVSAAETPTGQIEGGNIYRAANVTKGGEFVDPTNATCGETVQFRVRIHNVGAYALENVKVQATLPSAAATSHSSKVTVSASNGNTVTDTAGVTLDKEATLAYVAGSTELLDANQNKLANLADGIVGGGVTLADKVGVSTQQKRSVQFKAKVSCPTPPPVVKNITVCELATKKIVTIKESDFNASKHSKNLNDCKETPVPGKIQVCEIATKKVITISENAFDASKHSKDLNTCVETPVVETPAVIAATGPAGTIASMFGLSSLAAGATYFVRSRRNLLG